VVELSQPNTKLRPDQVDALIADYRTGLNLTALGDKYDIHRQTGRAHPLR
jgi:hypothetical protein